MRIILTLMLGLAIIAAGECSEVPSMVIPAGEILAHIQNGTEYDHIIVKGDLNFNAISSRNGNHRDAIIRINDSIVEGTVYMNGLDFNQSLDFENTSFEEDIVCSGSHFHNEINFAGSQFSITHQQSFEARRKWVRAILLHLADT